ncbi:MAG: serpin family protein [Bacteroidales bacterium]|nr:serpin family protein [Bacteroidales bacterium]
MKNQFFLTTAIIVVLIHGCDFSAIEGPNRKDMNTGEVKSAIVEANNAFALNIFKEINKNEELQKNVFISPLSMYYALSLAGIGAEKETLEAFQVVLDQKGYDKQTMLEAISGLYNEVLPKNNLVTVEIANSVWPADWFPVKKGFIDIARNYFDAEVQNLDYSVPEASTIINNWVEEKTHDKIKDLLGELDDETVLVLVNAIYFKGDWKYQFNDSANVSDNFYTNAGTTERVVFMKQLENFSYLENDLFSSVKLPYVDSNYFMVVLLPSANKNANDIIGEMTVENWSDWMESYSVEEVSISLPKFKYTFGTRNIIPELSALGLDIAFTGLANFSGISDTSILISQVVHKAFIEVNEEGSEAAAATGIVFEITSVGEPPKTKYFNVNRPFVFAICEKKSNAIMFMGKVMLPEQQ